MTVVHWYVLAGILLLTHTLCGRWQGRVLLGNAMIHLGIGWVPGPDAWNLLRTDPRAHADLMDCRDVYRRARRVVPPVAASVPCWSLSARGPCDSAALVG